MTLLNLMYCIALSGALKILNPLDYESSNKDYTLTIQVQDLGTPQFSATTQITICVLDTNDNGPKFTDTLMDAISIPENVENKDFITSFETTDADEYPYNGAILSIISGNELGAFYFNETTNELYVLNSSLLDYETGNVIYTLTIQAVDSGNNQFTDNTTVCYNNNILYNKMYCIDR